MAVESVEALPPPVAPPVPEALPSEAEEGSNLIEGYSPRFKRDWRKYAAVKVVADFDSERCSITNKISARVLDGVGKIKASIERDFSGQYRNPQLGLITKYLTVLYDHEERNALVTASADLTNRLQLRVVGDAKAQQGEMKLLTNFSDSKYKADISYDVPPTGLPRLGVTFPNGEIKLISDEAQALSINGLVVGNIMNGMCMAQYDGDLNLKYAYKDEEMAFIPSVTLPSKEVSFAFKRKFNPLNKLSYLYNFSTTAWSAVYKHKPNDDYKVKVGYDSESRLGWASAWVGKEEAGAKQAPRKLKFQVMLQIPQDNVKSSAVLFRMKKRWDL